jgi:hypothetical protein
MKVSWSLSAHRPCAPNASEPNEAKPDPQLEQLICCVAPSRIEVNTRLVMICDCCALATLVTEFVMSATVEVGEDTETSPDRIDRACT